MASYYGISLTADHWCLAFLGVNSGCATRDSDCAVPLDNRHGTQAILKSFEKMVALRRHVKQTERAMINKTESDVHKSIVAEIQRANLPHYFKKYFEDEVDVEGTIGIAHPYGLSPAIRRALPALIGLESIDQNRKAPNDHVLAIRPEKPGSVKRACAVEFPFAACLELLARFDMRPSSLVILFGEAVDAIELALVVVISDGTTLTLAISDYLEISSDATDKALTIAASRIKRDEAITSVTVCYVDEANCPMAKSVTDSLRTITSLTIQLVRLEPKDIAFGAARYAALCSGEKTGTVTGENGSTEVRFSSIAPFSIGVCGQDSNGEVQWCPIVEAGDPFTPENVCTLHFAGKYRVPPQLILAECLRQNRCRGEWVTVTKEALAHWDEEFRWYAEVPVAVPPDTSEGAIKIKIESSTECLSYGWSDPFIQGLFMPALIEPRKS